MKKTDRKEKVQAKEVEESKKENKNFILLYLIS